MSAYMRNPVVLMNHGYHPVLGHLSIGRSEDVRVVGGALKATVILDPANTPITGPYAEMIKMKLEAKSLFACSVGFRPIDLDYEDHEDALSGGFKFNRQELTEWSVVSVPCNPDCLTDTNSSVIDGIRDAVTASKKRLRFTTAPNTPARKIEAQRFLSRIGY